VPGALEAMLALGWVVDPADEDFLVAPKGYKPSMADVSDAVFWRIRVVL